MVHAGGVEADGTQRPGFSDVVQVLPVRGRAISNG